MAGLAVGEGSWAVGVEVGWGVFVAAAVGLGGDGVAAGAHAASTSRIMIAPMNMQTLVFVIVILGVISFTSITPLPGPQFTAAAMDTMKKLAITALLWEKP